MADEQPGFIAEVIDQRPDTRVTASGRFEEGKSVTIRTASGVEDSFFVPDQVYSAEVVQAMAQARAIELEQVQGMLIPRPPG